MGKTAVLCKVGNEALVFPFPASEARYNPNPNISHRCTEQPTDPGHVNKHGNERSCDFFFPEIEHHCIASSRISAVMRV